MAERKVNYRLRDWGISRQRYWGCPIPMIHCEHCGVVPVPKADLPVKLPDDVDFDKPGNPLDHHPTWKHVELPAMRQAMRAARPTRWTRSSIRPGISPASPRPGRMSRPIPKAANDWLPVDQYIGGVEHAILHLLYSRFFTRAMQQDRPCRHGRAVQGPVHPGHGGARDLPRRIGVEWPLAGADRGAARGRRRRAPRLRHRHRRGRRDRPIEKMSKSKKNMVDPDDITDSYGADTARWFMLSDSPPERDVEWTEAGVAGAHRFLQRIWRLVSTAAEALAGVKPAAADAGEARAVSQGHAQDPEGGRRRHRETGLQPRHRPDLRTGQCADRAAQRGGGRQGRCGAARRLPRGGGDPGAADRAR